MSTITLDFRYYYQKGERRRATQDAYQWDLGHVAEIFVPEDATYNIGYYFSDYTQTEDYAIESIEAVDDGGYKLTAHVPNKYFERSGELCIYIIGLADDHVITTYEGSLTIRKRPQPDDYVDPDPENGARTDEQQTHVYAQQSEAWAVGTIDGAPVESTDIQYNNYSKYYAEQAAGSATAAAGSATAAAAVQAAVEVMIGTFATIEESTTASRAYKVGEYLILNNILYRVTVAIASGGTITPNTNCVQTTVGDEISNNVLRFDSVAVSATTGDIATVSDSRITADHVVVECVWGNPSYITTNVTATTAAGSLTLNGTATAATTATVTLVKKDN